MKVLSILIPTYNMEKYLANCVDSMLAIEKKEQLEIIIVNDGSKDDSLEIAKSYKEKYPSIVKVVDKENGGYGSTINKGIKEATGKYFKVVDSDDWVNSKNVDAFLSELAIENADMVISDFTCVYENEGRNEIMNGIEASPRIEYSFDKFPIKQRLSMHKLFFKTELLKSINLLEKCFYVDVEYVSYGVSKCSSFKYIPLDIYQYRLGRAGQSVSIDGYYKHKEDLLKVANSLLQKYSEEKNDNSKEYIHLELAALLKTIYSLMIKFYLKDKKTKGMMQELDESLKKVDLLLYEESNNAVRFHIMSLIRKTNYKLLAPVSVLKQIF